MKFPQLFLFYFSRNILDKINHAYSFLVFLIICTILVGLAKVVRILLSPLPFKGMLCELKQTWDSFTPYCVL